VIVLDTSVLIDALTGPKRSARSLRRAIADGERLLLPSIVLYEWLRGPRLQVEVAAQEALFPLQSVAPFGSPEAAKAAALYKALRQPRGREIDIAIAAIAIKRAALLWTLNTRDFDDMPDIRLYTPAATDLTD